MKILRDFIFLFFTIVATVGCSPNGPKTDGKHQDNDSLSSVLTAEKITGTWENCLSEFGETKVTAKACRKIEFKKNNTGILTHGDSSTENIAWTISGGDLRIDLTDPRTDSIYFAFSDTLYEATLLKDTLSWNLDLKAKHKNYIYHLSK